MLAPGSTISFAHTRPIKLTNSKTEPPFDSVDSGRLQSLIAAHHKRNEWSKGVAEPERLHGLGAYHLDRAEFMA
jgi:hypothetical protein